MTKLEKLEFVLNVFSKRLLPAVLCIENPIKFAQWQGNMCKQAALLSVFIIEHYVGDEYTVEAYEGFFEHEDLGSYNHCWNYLVHHSDPKKNVICDFTSTITYMDYCEHNDPMLHIRKNPQSVVEKQIKMIGHQQINIDKELAQNEFYTGCTGDELKLIFSRMLRTAKLWEA